MILEMEKKENVSEFYKCFGYKGFWLYEFINKLMKRTKCKNVLVLSFLLFIIPPIIIFLPELITRFDIISSFSFFTILSLIMAGSWSLIGPLCIYSYHNKLVNFAKSLNLNENISKKTLSSIFDKTLKNLNRNVTLISIIWTSIVLIILLINPDSMNAYGFFGFRDFYFICLLCYIVFLLNLTACGFYFAIITVKIIIEFSKKSKIIQNILENNQFGVKIFGKLSFCATLYFSSGLLYFPILIDCCRVNNIEIANLTAIPIIIYIIFLLYVYLYPNYKICLRAYIAKEKILSKLQNKYIDCIKSLDTQQEMSKQVYMVNLYNSIDYISKINIYPTSVNNIIMIFSTVILPAMFFFIDKLDFLYEPIFEKLIF